MTMDVRKAQTTTETKAARAKAFGGFGELRAEFKRISWTGREELKAYTKIVVASCFIVGLGVYVLDVLVQGCFSGIGAVLHAIAG